MGYLTACYTAKCRFFHNSDREATIHWYWAEKGAAKFPHPHIFHSHVYMAKQIDPNDWSHVGEIAGTRKYSTGANIWGYLGKQGCMVGTPYDFAHGLDVAATGNIEYPPCCRKPPGGLKFSGTARWAKRRGCVPRRMIAWPHMTNIAFCGCWASMPLNIEMFRDPDTDIWSFEFELTCGFTVSVEVFFHLDEDDQLVGTALTTFSNDCSGPHAVTHPVICVHPTTGEKQFSWGGPLTPKLPAACGCLSDPLGGTLSVSAFGLPEPEYEATGGIVLDGEATRTVKPRRVRSSTGGIVLDGEATIEQGDISVGGIIISGMALYSYTQDYAYDATGGIIISGMASLSRVRDASGGITLSGAADYDVMLNESGGIIISGEATYSYTQDYSYLATGGLFFGGTS